MGELMPRWEHVETRLEDHMAMDNERYGRLSGQLRDIDHKLDALQSWTDNLKGRMVVVGVSVAFIGPTVVGIILKYL